MTITSCHGQQNCMAENEGEALSIIVCGLSPEPRGHFQRGDSRNGFNELIDISPRKGKDHHFTQMKKSTN